MRRLCRSLVIFHALDALGVARLGLFVIQPLLGARRQPAGMGVEPRIGQLAARVEHLAARLLHRLADARVHARRVIRLRLLDVRGDIRAVVHGFLLGDELQHKRARQNRLRLERLQRPISRHFPGQHGGQIILDGQGFQRLAFHVVDPEHRHTGFVFAQPIRHKLRRARPLRLARGALRLRQGLSPPPLCAAQPNRHRQSTQKKISHPRFISSLRGIICAGMAEICAGCRPGGLILIVHVPRRDIRDNAIHQNHADIRVVFEQRRLLAAGVRRPHRGHPLIVIDVDRVAGAAVC